MGRVIRSLKQRVPVAPQNGPRSNKNFFKKPVIHRIFDASIGEDQNRGHRWHKMLWDYILFETAILFEEYVRLFHILY